MSELRGKSLGELRQIAKGFGINPAGLNIADLTRAIEKAQAAKGKDSDAPKKRGPGRPRKDESAPVKAKSEPKVDKSEDLKALKQQLAVHEATNALVVSTLVKLAKAVGEDGLIPKEWAKSSKGKTGPAKVDEVADDDDDDDGDEGGDDDDDGDEGDDDDDDDDDGDEGGDDDDDDDESSEEVEVTASSINRMTSAQLIELASAINKDKGLQKASNGAQIKLTDGVVALRGGILDFLSKFGGDRRVDAGEVPEHVRVGGRVKVDVSDDTSSPNWVRGRILAVDRKNKECEVALDAEIDGNDIADVPWSLTRAIDKHPKPR